MGGNKSRSWLYQGAQGGVGVALSALFKQRIGAFRHFLGPFPGSIPQAMGHKPKKRGTNGPQGDAIGHCMALRALWSAFLRHFHDSQWAPPKPDANPHRESGAQSAGGQKRPQTQRGANVVKEAHMFAIGRSAGHRSNRFISMLNYAPRYFPSRDFRLP